MKPKELNGTKQSKTKGKRKKNLGVKSALGLNLQQ